jgi:hypothetical protein
MAVVDNGFSLILFMIQATASAALLNQIETRIQANTPSAVRASILSIVSAMGRAITIPASLALGWLFKDYGAFWAVRAVAIIAVIVLIYWIVSSRSIKHADDPIAA